MHKEQLEYFWLAYRMKNISAAAAKIPMSKQGLLKSIRSLENELGVMLFSNDVHGSYSPTIYADELVKMIDKWDKDYQVLMENFRHIKAQEIHEISLGTSLGIIGLLGPEFLSGFHKIHPEISVNYSEANDAFIDNGLEQGMFDLALTIAPYKDGFATTELYSCPICFWINKTSELASKENITVSDLKDTAIAIPGKDFKCYNSLKEACGKAEVDFPEIVASSEIFWLYEYALSGKGIGFTTEALTKLPIYNRDDSVVSVPLADIPWRFGIAYMPQRELSDIEQTFFDYCIEFAKKLR